MNILDYNPSEVFDSAVAQTIVTTPSGFVHHEHPLYENMKKLDAYKRLTFSQKYAVELVFLHLQYVYLHKYEKGENLTFYLQPEFIAGLMDEAAATLDEEAANVNYVLTAEEKNKILATINLPNKVTFSNNILCIGGNPGTGKSTFIAFITKHVLEILHPVIGSKQVLVQAPSNSATLNIGTATERPYATSSKSFKKTRKAEIAEDYSPINKQFIFKEGKLPLDEIQLLIWDEISMESDDMAVKFKAYAKENKAKAFYLLGDINQLPAANAIKFDSALFETPCVTTELLFSKRYPYFSPIRELVSLIIEDIENARKDVVTDYVSGKCVNMLRQQHQLYVEHRNGRKYGYSIVSPTAIGKTIVRNLQAYDPAQVSSYGYQALLKNFVDYYYNTVAYRENPRYVTTVCGTNRTVNELNRAIHYQLYGTYDIVEGQYLMAYENMRIADGDYMTNAITNSHMYRVLYVSEKRERREQYTEIVENADGTLQYVESVSEYTMTNGQLVFVQDIPGKPIYITKGRTLILQDVQKGSAPLSSDELKFLATAKQKTKYAKVGRLISVFITDKESYPVLAHKFFKRYVLQEDEGDPPALLRENNADKSFKPPLNIPMFRDELAWKSQLKRAHLSEDLNFWNDNMLLEDVYYLPDVDEDDCLQSFNVQFTKHDDIRRYSNTLLYYPHERKAMNMQLLSKTFDFPYAMTIHKFQGLESEILISLFDDTLHQKALNFAIWLKMLNVTFSRPQRNLQIVSDELY